jgi:F-type H+-transporting ATPase subunit b
LIPDITTLWVIVLVLLTIFLVNTLIFKPILAVIEARLKAVSDARTLAQTAAERARAASAEYNDKLGAARSEIYGEMDEKRRAALAARAATLGDTKAAVEREVSDASTRVQLEAAAARATLDREAEGIADTIVARVLGRAS